MIERVKLLRGHSALARFLAEVGDEIGFVPRGWFSEIPSPYRYSPIKSIYEWRGKRVCWIEFSHAMYGVYELPAAAKLYASPDEAEEANFKAEAA